MSCLGLIQFGKHSSPSVLMAKPEEGLVIRRELSSQGKSVSRINGHIVTMSMLRETGECLVNIHGQHEHQSLFRTERHLDWLDSYAGDKIAATLAQYKEAFKQYEKVRVISSESLRIHPVKTCKCLICIVFKSKKLIQQGLNLMRMNCLLKRS